MGVVIGYIEKLDQVLYLLGGHIAEFHGREINAGDLELAAYLGDRTGARVVDQHVRLPE